VQIYRSVWFSSVDPPPPKDPPFPQCPQKPPVHYYGNGTNVTHRLGFSFHWKPQFSLPPKSIFSTIPFFCIYFYLAFVLLTRFLSTQPIFPLPIFHYLFLSFSSFFAPLLDDSSPLLSLSTQPFLRTRRFLGVILVNTSLLLPSHPPFFFPLSFSLGIFNLT